ncbi:class E sortase [Nocardioides anomalus]|uniref:Class E sortase n=1 Tax=Nocardioides anomalus TaxID=2712223 RepID=A0A6G6WDP8_9ACTN|nr:class E sortase [Nocardioides anomalus]QIG43354.1 class E sortase [Nocardioides anomalus]
MARPDDVRLTIGRSARTTGPRRVVPRLVGVLLVLAGLALGAFVAWEYWGTTWVAQRHQAEATRQLEDGWADGRATARVGAGEVTAIVRIPAFGPSYAVPLLEGDSEDVLATGFGHVPGTAPPGEEGNAVLAGHRVTHGEPLRDMPSLEPGDTVVVDTHDRRLVYELDTPGDGLEVDAGASWVLDAAPRNPDGGPDPASAPRLLTLVTCADLFHSDERLVAFAHLVSDGPRPS